ncbi:4'-phosphopantetheinyl transferase superfamily protein [Psychrobacter sp. AntiMn-1]|uniref:4'-phosphopantetheinyl transferase superfamily protein n=1 Tax=Psychrobacter sp. AntiMn-1 TaxID=1720344 RepID=UPI0009F4CC24|nr:4'-phosphopantetheinyl transferase superfamily protein [Psychrobacter sp. AntiMn-1]
MIIPVLNITNVQLTQLDHETWCVTAQVSDLSSPVGMSNLWNDLYWLSVYPSSHIVFTELRHFKWHYHAVQKPISKRSIAHRQRQQQRQGVRQLLQALLNKLEISDTLDESSFPYRLSKSKYYVCFSHTAAHNKDEFNKKSHQNIPAISYSKIAAVISRRRPAGIDIEHNDVAWHIVKRFYSDNEVTILQTLPKNQRDYIAKLLWQIKESFIKIHQYTLAQGLGIDYSDVIPALTDNMNKDFITISHTNDQSNHQIAVLQADQTVVVF